LPILEAHSMTIAHNLGFPRIGERRELKKATEAYWKNELDRAGLEATGAELRRANWERQRRAGIQLIPANDFSFYDQVLDMSCLLGNVPSRFDWDGSNADVDVAFAMARGVPGKDAAYAAEMTKWFDTNYHYIVPEFGANTRFRRASTKVFDEVHEALEWGIKTKPVLIAPVTYRALGKVVDGSATDKLALLDQLLPVYVEIVAQLVEAGAEWVQFDEPIFSLDLDDAQREAIRKTYDTLAQIEGVKILVSNYFGELRDNMELFTSLPVTGLHIDAVRGRQELTPIAARLDDAKHLSVGIVDGRNVWKTDYEDALQALQFVQREIGSERLVLCP